MYKIILLFFVTIVFSVSCTRLKNADERTNINAACDRFMKAFTDERYTDAFVTLKANTVIADSLINSLMNTCKIQMKNVFEEYGKPISYNFIEDKQVADFIAKRIYVVRFEKYYLTFSFILYKGSKDWKITKFAYTEGSQELL